MLWLEELQNILPFAVELLSVFTFTHVRIQVTSTHIDDRYSTEVGLIHEQC